MSQIVFENATVFDGESADLHEGMSVRVEDDLIREVSDGSIAAGNADRIDCAGRTLMPGMIDCHVHVYFSSVQIEHLAKPATYHAHYAARFLRHILGCGFTTVRDVAGGDHGLAMALREGLLDGPRFLYGGLSLTQTGGHGDLRPQSLETDW